jgi:hypothetical protein
MTPRRLVSEQDSRLRYDRSSAIALNRSENDDGMRADGGHYDDHQTLKTTATQRGDGAVDLHLSDDKSRKLPGRFF